jgi:transposase
MVDSRRLGVISISPGKRHLRLAFRVQSDNVRTEHVVEFLRQLRRDLRRPLVVVMDRLPAHRSAAKRFSLPRKQRSIHIEWLPAYAPELNPVEYQWSHAKGSCQANYAPPNLTELRHAVNDALAYQREEQALLKSFFQGAKLNL